MKHYQLKEQKRAILEQAAVVKDTNWWKRLIGTTRKEQLKLNGMILNFRSSRDRYKEQLRSKVQQRAQERARLKKRQEDAQTRLLTRIAEERKSERYSIRLQEPPQMDRTHTRNRDGYGMER